MKTKIKKKRVVVAMSGGVDSSVAAALLKQDGFEVIGVTMCLNVTAADKKRPSCCGIDGIEDAKRVAGKLAIPHYVLNFGKTLEEKVIRDFCLEYLRGRTPNPCIRCNRYLKFEALFKKARQLDADYLATGHYARIVYQARTKSYLLKKGKDKQKDQSYFLCSIRKEILPHILMPLGDLTKEKTRQIAQHFKLPVADKPGSQEICFIPDDYREFLKQAVKNIFGKRVPLTMKSGEIQDKNGNTLGEHQGAAFYTIGQREGLGIALGRPAYVIAIDAKRNILTVGDKEDTFFSGLLVKELNFIGGNLFAKNVEVKVKIRYNHKEVKSRLKLLSRNSARVIFLKPQRAVTPGQSAVFYKDDVVLGGGIIDRSIS